MKRFIAGLLTVALLIGFCSVIPFEAKAETFSGVCGDNLTWTLDEDGVLNISGTGEMYDEDQPWMDCGVMIQSVVIESGVTSIGDRVFAVSPELMSVEIADTVESIGECAFEFCSNLQTIEIPASVRTIGKGAFRDCHMLDGIWVDGDNCYYQSDRSGVLFDRNGFTLIAAPGNLTGDYEMPYGVKTIQEEAFSRCGVSTVKLSASVNKIEQRAFYWNNLSAIYVDEENQNFYSDEYGVLYSSDHNIIQVPAFVSEEYVIPDNVGCIGRYAFSNCMNLYAVTIPDSVYLIQEYGFEGCMLAELYIGTGLTCIEESAFAGVAPSDIYYAGTEEQWNQIQIGDYNWELQNATMHFLWKEGPVILAEGKCGPNLNWMLDEDGKLTISGTGAMYNYDREYDGVKWADYRSAVKTIVMEPGITAIGQYAFYKFSKVTSVTIPSTVKTIDEYAFYCCSNLPVITIPNSVTTIGSNAFNFCGKLTSVKIPDSVTSMGGYVFFDCASLPSVKLPDGLTEIGNSMFSGCSALESVTIPDTVTAIGENAFYWCNNLTELTIPEGVTTIGREAFSYCTKLTDVYYGGSENQWKKISVSTGNNPLLNATIHFAKVDAPTVESVSVKTLPGKTEYNQGETLDTAGLVVTVTYSDGTETDITEGFTVAGFEPQTVGKQTVTVTYEGFPATFDVTVVAAPMEIAAFNGAEGVDVTWTANSGAAKYKVYQRYQSSGNWTGWVLVSTGKILGFTHTAAKNGIVYEYKVTAVDAEDNELETVSSESVMRLNPTTVTLNNTASAINISWTSNSKAQAFRISRSQYENGNWSQWTTITDATGTTFSDTTVEDGVNYRYMVQAVNGTYTGAESNIPEMTRLVSPAVNAENTDDGIALSWNPSKAEGVTYNVYRSKNSSGTWSSWSKLDSVTETAYLDTTADNGAQYRYMVRVSNGTVTSAAVAGTIIVRRTITDMAVTTLPKTIYTLGDPLDLTGGIATVYYSNNTTETYPLAELEVTGFDSQSVGTKTMTVAFKNVNCTFEITVKEPVFMESISVTKLPHKTVYSEGEGFDPAGLEVTLHFSDGTTEIITDYTLTGYDATPGDKVMTVTYGQFTTTFTVTVEKKETVSIAITSLPVRLVYVAGAKLDTTGMVVTAYYADGTQAQISDYTVTADLSNAGEQTVTVSYAGFTDTFAVTVYPQATLHVTAQNGTTGIEVSWTAENAQKFKVYQRYFASDVWSEWVLVSNTSSNKFNHTAAKNGLLYCYKVVAYRDDVVVSEMQTDTLMRLNPPEVTVENGVSGVQINWTANSKATAYQVYRCQLEGEVWTDWAYIADVTDTTYTDTTAVNATRYRYGVKPVCDTYLGAMSEMAAILRMETIPVTVSNVVSGIRISWQANAAAAKYYLYRSEQSGTTWSEWSRIITTESNMYSDLTAKNGVRYRYMVRGVNNTQISAGTSGSFVMRLAITSVSASNLTGGIRVSWGQNKSATSYNVYRSEEQNGQWTAWGKPIVNTTEIAYTDTTAVNGVRYRYMVRSLNGDDISGAKTGAILYRLESPTVTMENISAGIRVSWTENAEATKYFVYRSAYENGAWSEWKIFIKASAGTTRYDDYSVESNVRYRYMVRVYKGDNQSAGKASDPIRRITTTTANVSAVNTYIRITWVANVSAGSYNVYRRSYNAATASYSDWELLGNTRELVMQDMTAVKGVTYQYTVRCVNSTDIGPVKASANVRW